jgi:small subunit ribosomal protein S7
MVEVKLFDKWDMEGIKVEEPGLKRYITMRPIIVPKTGAKYVGNKFHKSQITIVERLINKVMVTGHKGKKHIITSGQHTGKKLDALKIVKEAFEIIEEKTKKNPVEVYVKALENASPREEIITIEYGGARYPKAVECSPQRRIDITLRLMVQGMYHRAFGKKLKSSAALADEIINAYKMSNSSNAIAKKLELERQADSSR